MNQTKPDFLLVGKPFHIFDMVYLDEQEVFDLYKKMGFDFIHMLSGDFYVEIQEGDSRFLVNNGLPVYVNLDDASFHRYIPKQYSLDRINQTFLLMSKLRPSYNIVVNEFLFLPPGMSNKHSYDFYKKFYKCLSYYCYQTMFDNYRRLPEYSIVESKNEKIIRIKNHSMLFRKFQEIYNFDNIEVISSYYVKKFSTLYKSCQNSLLCLSPGFDSQTIHFLLDMNDINHSCYSYPDFPYERKEVYENSKNIKIVNDSYFSINNKTLYNIWKKFCISHSGFTIFFNERCLINLIAEYKNDFDHCFDGSTLLHEYGTYYFKEKEDLMPKISFSSGGFNLEKRMRGFSYNDFKKFPLADKVLFEVQKKWRKGNKILFYNELFEKFVKNNTKSKYITTTMGQSELKYSKSNYDIEFIEHVDTFGINFHFLSVLLYLMENVFDVDYDMFGYVYKNFNKKVFETSKTGILNILEMGMNGYGWS